MYVASAKRLTLAGARKIAATAIGMADAAGVAISVAIADAGGNLLLFERMDGGRFHTVHSATTKATCAASSMRQRWTAMEGGCPVIVDGECLGGVGVSGGSFEFDEHVAKAAAASIGGS